MQNFMAMLQRLTLDNNDRVIDFHPNNNKKKNKKITGQTPNDHTKDVEIMVPLKYLSNFLRNLEMPSN